MPKRLFPLVTLTTLLAACGASNGPEGVAQQYERALYHLDGPALLKLVTKEDRAAYPSPQALESALAEQLFVPDPALTRQVYQRATTKLGDVAREQDRATVVMNDQVPNLDEAGAATMIAGLASSAGALKSSDQSAAAKEILDLARKAPLEQHYIHLKLVRENGVWKVSPGWAAKVKREHLDALKSSYQARLDRGDFRAALNTLKELAGLQPNDQGYQQDLKNLTYTIGLLKQITFSDTTGALERGDFAYQTTIHNPLTQDLQDVYLRVTFKNESKVVGERFGTYKHTFLLPTVGAGGTRPLGGTLTPPEDWNGKDYAIEASGFLVTAPQ